MEARRITPRWSGLLATMLVLTVCAVGMAGAETLAFQHLSLEDRTILDRNQAIDVIIEFDQTEAARMAAEHQRRAGLRAEDEAILAERAQAYRRQKDQVLTVLATEFSAEAFQIARDYRHLPMLSARLRSPAALQALLRQPGVKAVHSNIRLRPMLAQSLPLIRQPETAAQGGAGAGTTVAVLDTGVDYTRAAFGDCAAPGGSCKVAFARDFATDDGTRDSDGHGTNIAGIVLGVAPGARIAALDVFRNDGFAYSNDLIAAIDWVIANQSAYNIVAMNLSLGGGRHAGPCSADVLATPIANARAAGVLAVIASGNDGYKNAVSSPACAPAAVAVGAIYDAPQGGFNWSNCTDRATQADQVTCFSNSASVLTLLAPGALIAAAGETMGGTSQATPHVAGAIAVLRAAFPGETLDTTLARLGNTGRPITDSNGITTPRIDLLAAYTVDRTAYPLTVGKAGTGGGVVRSDSPGIDCGSQCGAEFSAGTPVTLTATTDAGSMFVGWSGDCAGPEAVCTVDMTTAKTVTATFNVIADGGEVFPPNGVWPSGWTIPTTTDAGWFVASDWASEGRYSLRSGRIGHHQQSQIEVSGHFQAGVVRFTFYISSEIDYDWLVFSIDGIEQNAWSGEGSRTVSFPLAAGHHTLRWSYEKDGSISSGSDAAWIDEVSFPAVASDGDPSTVLITHYYLTILSRTPDDDGLAYWQELIAERQAQGVDVKPVFREMAYFFFNNPEYLGRNTTDAEYLYNLYLTFFQRNPDRGGLEFWLNQLAAGISRNTVMNDFLHSPEFADFMRDLGL